MAILLTVIYSVRLSYLLLIKPLGGKKLINLGEEILITVPISLLFYLAITGGSFII